MNLPLIRLFQLIDSALPIGGFAHSAGLETYVQQGIVKDTATAKTFIIEMLTQNVQFTDAAIVSLSYDYATQNDFDNILLLDDECNAVKLPREIRQSSQKLCTRLLKIFQPLCKSNIAHQYQNAILDDKATGHYCIAFGMYASAMQIDKVDALAGFFYNTAAGFVSNCVKLIPLGQQSGQEILFSLQPLIHQLAIQCLHPNKELIGLCCTGFDIKSMQHELLYSRLYMS